MPNRRKHKRRKVHVRVTYGEEELDARGYARNISLGGMFLDCRRPPPVGTRLHLHLEHDDREFYLEGVVVRQKVVNPQLRQIDKQGIGIRFLTPAELITGVIPKAERASPASAIVCENQADVQRLLDQQLSARVLVVPLSDDVPALGEMVEFEIDVQFGDPITVDGHGRVVQFIGEGDARQAVLEVQDADSVRVALEEASS